MKKGRRQDQLPPIVRSPALEAVERQPRGSRQSERNANQSMARRRNIGTSRVSFAVEDTLVRPVAPRKSLKPLSTRVRQRTGLTASWRSRVAAPSPLPVEAISQEEQKKLAELEMRLPRVAGRIDSWLLVTVLALLCIGLVMVYSASSFIAARYYGDPAYFFLKQLLWALIGVAVMLVTMRIDYRHWRRVSLFGLIIVLPLLVVVLLVGTSAYGASRWLAFGSFFSFQPSELAKLVLALYIADWLARKGNQVGTFLYGLAPFVILVGVILGLVLLENDMGTAIIIAGLATAMFFTAGANIIQFLLAMGCGGLIFLSQAFKGYRAARWDFLDPFKHITSTNLQLYQSLLALGSGGWLGLGLGASREKAGYLPLPYIDSIFAVIGEELGFIGAALIVILFMFLAFRGFRLARRTQDVYGALLSTGITTWLILQVVINIGSTTGSIPYTGVPLPFISFGGSSLVISLAAVGVLLNISRYIQEPETPALSRDIITKTLSTKKLKKKV
ncbi:MAG TPA: putative lipid II flippase FtsW [Ktedonosporobacter sp.]|nr:putative lipid II flippase FtsW [Ktedonosporobacter sp.]